MSSLDQPRQPSSTERRIFGLLLLLCFGVAGAILGWRTGTWRLPAALWIAGGVLALVYYAVPPLRWPLYTLWMGGALRLGWLVSNLLLAVIFYGVVTPYGFVMRLWRRDKLQLALNRRTSTYWAPIAGAPGKGRYFKQS